MPTVRTWTGHEARALRRAKRMGVRGFADHLGMAARTVSQWERLGVRREPRPDTQAILDTVLARATPDEQARFEALLAKTVDEAPPRPFPVPREWDHETWTEDIERALVLVNRQSLAQATSLLDRRLTRSVPADLDDQGRYLYARSLVLLGDVRRDQGALHGPSSADHHYRRAREMFTALDIPRRVAQIDLSLAVVAEMTGRLEESARMYELLASDRRLGERDQARARLWIGTALSKAGRHGRAIEEMAEATRCFEDLDEPDDWSVAQQKLALAHRGAGTIGRALHHIDIALAHRVTDAPMQQVRLDTAHAHILVTDRATIDAGLTLLDRTAQLAAQHGLSHQLHSIDAIRRTCE
ncbi:hypothetical protein [Embleya sp. MST-111070]|uniref:hypothetical protein n=1 Tax=Embleya sp. MST-111070 TaxID=3398231 RepID=UPI003F731E7B